MWCEVRWGEERWGAMKTEICGSHSFFPFTYLSLPSFTSATAPSDPSNLTYQETTSILLPRYLGAKESWGPRRSPQSCPDLPQQKTKWLRYHSPLLSRLPSTCQYFHFSTISLCYVMFRFAEVLFQVLDKRESSATWPFSAVPPLRRALIHFHCCCPDWYIIYIIYIIYKFIYLYIFIFMYLCIYIYLTFSVLTLYLDLNLKFPMQWWITSSRISEIMTFLLLTRNIHGNRGRIQRAVLR